MSTRGAPPPLEIREESASALRDYATVSIAFTVDRVLVLDSPLRGLAGFELRERPVAEPWLKDYDSLPEGHPTDWPERFDLSGWGFLAAYVDGVRAGGATLAYRTRGLDLLRDRSDLALLWDLRVAPESRGRGVGSALFQRAVAWARERACARLAAETQNVNVAACRFYASQGCELGAIDRFAYPDLPDETQLLWYRDVRAAWNRDVPASP